MHVSGQDKNPTKQKGLLAFFGKGKSGVVLTMTSAPTIVPSCSGSSSNSPSMLSHADSHFEPPLSEATTHATPILLLAYNVINVLESLIDGPKTSMAMATPTQNEIG